MALSLMAATIVSCSSGDMAQDTPWNLDGGDAKTGISFNTSIGSRSVDQTIDVLHSSGFGVFAYSQGSDSWTTYSHTSLTPSFMDNVMVTWSSESNSWTYSDQKSWQGSRKFSFFSYAPYESTLSTTAATTSGVRLVLYGQYGGPALEYTLPESDLTRTEDLCYADPSNLIDQTEYTVTNGTVTINFQHATSKNTYKVVVENDVDAITHEKLDNNQPLDDKTTIKIDKIELIGTLPTKGILSLGTGAWTLGNTAEHTMTLSSDLFQDNIKDGITGSEALTAVNLLSDANGSAFTLIPGGTYKLKVTYRVIIDQVTISKETTVNVTLSPEKGKSYTSVLRFEPTGILTSDFTVNPWGDVTYTIPEGSYDYGLVSVQFLVADWNEVSYDITEDWATTATNTIGVTINDWSGQIYDITEDWPYIISEWNEAGYSIDEGGY